MALQNQKGFSLSGLLMWSVALVLAAILGMKVVPVYIENATIKKNLVAVVNDASLQNASASQLRNSFAKRARIDNIDVITTKDIVIKKEKGNLILSTNYIVLVPLVANVSLHFDFETSSE